MEIRYYDIAEVPQRKHLEDRFLFPFPTLNYLILGGIFNRITLLTSGTDNGKTTVCSQFIKSAIEQGIKVFAYFGEDGGMEARDRLYRQHFPYEKNNFEYRKYIQNGRETNVGEYFLKDDVWEKANEFYKGKLFLYNNNITANKENIIKTLEQARTEKGCKLFIIDNAEMFDLDTDNENKGIKEICIALRQWVISAKTHIVLVAHTRKIDREIVRPDIQDVKGTSALTNISKNIITVIRTDKLDKTLRPYKALKDLLTLNGYQLDEADAILEVRKTKGKGLGFICLKYNHISNTYYELKCNYQKEPEKQVVQKQLEDFVPIPNPDDLPF